MTTSSAPLHPCSSAPLLPLSLAYFSPLPPARSGIADYSRELLPHLAELVEITLFTAAPDNVAASLRPQFAIHPLNTYPQKRWQFDLALYQMGNSSHHEAMYPFLLRYPGVVVLHDYGLHHFMGHRTAVAGNYAGYVREMGYALGEAGANLAWEIWHGRQQHPTIEQPLNERVMDHSLGLIVHSDYARSRVRQQRPLLPIQQIPALITPYPGQSRRDTLSLSAETLIFASLGQVTAAKQVDLALRCFAQLRREIPNSHYLIAGEAAPEVDLDGLINSLDLAGSVTCTGFVADLAEFVDWVHTADVIVNLRYPTLGETSATALRALAAGRPLIVFDHGWYSELPDNVCYKVAPMDEAGLLAAMKQLGQEPARRQSLGRAAVSHIKTHHTPGSIAGAYVAFLQNLLAGLNANLSGLRKPDRFEQGGANV